MEPDRLEARARGNALRRRMGAVLSAVACSCALLVACEEQPAVPPGAVAPTPTQPAPAPEPAATLQFSCDNSAIILANVTGKLAGEIHGAIVADTLHMGGEEAPASCGAPVNEALVALPGERDAQVQQSRQYYLVVIRYNSGNRLYNIRIDTDGTSCVVDTNDVCVAEVSGLPADFDSDGLPDNVPPVIPAGRPTSRPTPPNVDDPPGEPGTGPGEGDAQPAPPPRTAPSWGSNARDAVKAFLDVHAHDVTTVNIPAPAGNPTPSVEIKFPDEYDYEAFGRLSLNGFRLRLDPLSLTLGRQDSERTRKIVLVATNSEGSAELEVRSTPTCGYSQSAVINLWLGTHPLPPASDAPYLHVPNELFEGHTSITVTSTGFVIGGVTSRFWTQSRARVRHWQGGPNQCGILVASADSGRVYVLDSMLAFADTKHGLAGGHILENLPAGSTTPACTDRWFDARIFSYYPTGHAYRDGALVNHEGC